MATTSVYRWQDDFVIRVTAGDNGGSIVDMRSKSRVGKSDLGANAHRIAAFLTDLRHAAR